MNLPAFAIMMFGDITGDTKKTFKHCTVALAFSCFVLFCLNIFSSSNTGVDLLKNSQLLAPIISYKNTGGFLFESLEYILAPFSVFMDLFCLCLFKFMRMMYLKNIFNTDKKNIYFAPLCVLLSYFICTTLAKNIYELESFYTDFAPFFNFFIGFFVPLIIFIVLKIKSKKSNQLQT